MREGLEATEIGAIIAAEICALTERAAQIAEAEMFEAGRGRPPEPYAVLVLGSAGRGDSLLSADQDNAIVFGSGDPLGPEDLWFSQAGSRIADILYAVGLPYCPGGVMAKNPGCRHDLAGWRKTVAGWIETADPAAALASDIFFDAVPAHGELALADNLMDFAFAEAAKSPRFLSVLAAMTRKWEPPIGLFGRLRSEQDGRLDLKRSGLLPIVTLARALALKHGIRARSTLERLADIGGRGLVDRELIGERRYGIQIDTNDCPDAANWRLPKRHTGIEPCGCGANGVKG